MNAQRPNIIYIVCDDLGYADLGCYGGREADFGAVSPNIDRLAADGHYETQERLITRIVHACATYPVIEALDIGLRKSPVRQGSGSLGVRVSVDAKTLSALR